MHNKNGENINRLVRATKERSLHELSNLDEVKGAGLQIVALNGESL